MPPPPQGASGGGKERASWATVAAVALGAAGAVAVVAARWRQGPAEVGLCEAQGVVLHGFAKDVPIEGGPKGSCWCGQADGYCLCTPSLSVDAGLLVCVEGSDVPMVAVVTRRFPPVGQALPGGFVDVGESAESAASREVREETGAHVAPSAFEQVRLFSDPRRDPRRHGAAMFMTAMAPAARLRAGDDASAVALRPLNASLRRGEFAFPDHFEMLAALVRRLERRSTPLCARGGPPLGVRILE